MLEQLMASFQGLGSSEVSAIGLVPLAGVLSLSLASSFFIAFLYQVFYRARSTGSHVYRAFPLMGISITAIFVSVQFSLPLSLGLLGALSIVRFRTPIKEPEEIGFILLVIATSLTAATFNFGFLGMILIVAVAALLLLRGPLAIFSTRQGDGVLVVGLPVEASDRLDQLMELAETRLPNGGIDSVTNTDDEVSFAYNFRGLGQDRVAELYTAFRAVDERARPSVFFHHGGNV